MFDKKDDDKKPEPEVKVVEKIVKVPVEKIVEKRVEVPVEKIVEKVVEVATGLDLTKEEVKGLLSHLPTYSEREHVMSAKKKLEEYLK